ncbi:MAG: FIST C-terminal domain-containing protein [Synergistaceae bacterium]|jgi:hypothetical protein|nr:FIST C-terminal domain-containing protein [Synergistaceae bacterium]
MIEAITAHTREIDNVNSAVSEILAQIDIGKLRKNSVGILACHAEFILSGVVKTLCASLPFETAGLSSIASAVPGSCGTDALSLLVLTSDDVFFSSALSPALSAENWKASGEDLYRRALEGLPEGAGKCALGLAFMPFIPLRVGGDKILAVLDEASGGVPFFGGLATGYSLTDTPPPFVLFNGEEYTDRLAVVLLSGRVRPRFARVFIAESKVSVRKGIVTASEGNLVKTIDGMPAVSYLEKLGLTDGGKLRWILTIPVIIDCGDGADPVSLVIVDQTPEGYICMGGSVPVNSTFSVGSIDRGDVLAGAADILKLIAEERASVFLFFSCTLRARVLKLEQTAEIGRAAELLDDSVPYLFTYSGGEFCPLHSGDGDRTDNRFHNVTLIACALTEPQALPSESSSK